MKQVSRSALVSFSAEQMFHLVNDVARYPEFLPGCSGSCVLEQSEAHMVASVDVSKAGISKTFTTSNQLTPGVSIAMSLVMGLLKRCAVDGFSLRWMKPRVKLSCVWSLSFPAK